MKTVVPDYYEYFKCIAQNCRHSCCVGWEIDIDDAGLSRFQQIDGVMGSELKDNIALDPEPHFVLTEAERCPFLNDKGLCRLILEFGEEILCEICAEHPRFRNYLSDRTEIGLGLCCEEAVRLIMEKQDPIKLVISGESEEVPEDFELELLEEREEIFSLILDRSTSCKERIARLADAYDVNIDLWDMRVWAERFLRLERLDSKWTEVLNVIISQGKEVFFDDDILYENLLHYFIFRHFISEMFETSRDAVAFCILSVFMINAAHRAFRNISSEQRAEHIRLFSSEIEYSDENIGKIIEWLQ